MSNFQVLPQSQNYNKYDLISDLVTSMMQGAAKSQKQGYENKILESVLAGKPVQEAMSQDQPKGFLGNVGAAFNPNAAFQGSTSDLSPITQQVLASTLAPKLRDPLETERMRADIEESKSRGEYYKKGGGRSSTSVTVKPISHTGLTNYAKLMDSYIEQAKVGDIGDPDYTQENLLKSWSSYKTAVGWDQLPDNQKQQLWQNWNVKIADKGKKTIHARGLLGGNEYQWDPESPEVKAVGPDIGNNTRVPTDTAINQSTGQRIVSYDNQLTWYDADTGELIE